MTDLVCRVRRSSYKFKPAQRKRAKFRSLDVISGPRPLYELSERALAALVSIALLFTGANRLMQLFLCIKCLFNFAVIGSLMANCLNSRG